MVTLRIWHPSNLQKFKHGASSLSIVGVWGSAYVSTRPFDPAAAYTRKPVSQGGDVTATLQDDINAEGRETTDIWHFNRMDEARMLRLWGSMTERVGTVPIRLYDPTSSFRVSDLILAAGRGIAVEAQPTAGFADRARGQAVADAAATSFVQLQIRADYYAEVEHW